MRILLGVLLVAPLLGGRCEEGSTAPPEQRACSPGLDSFPFCNTSLPVPQRVWDLIGRLDLSEKPPLLTARESPKGNVSRLGIPEYDWGGNCVHGVQSRCVGDVCPTMFPSPNSLGNGWNASSWELMGYIIGRELRALRMHGAGENREDNLPHIGLDCWSPNINLNRDPRWGRNQEVVSEDPFLTSIYGLKYTRGLQRRSSDGYTLAIVTLKHFAAYSLDEWEGISRHSFDANVTARDFVDSYFPAFRTAVIGGDAKGVMCSYNSINGVPACANDWLLNTVLRGDWGFNGYITSDTGAIQDIYDQHKYVTDPEAAVAISVKAGCDVDSGAPYDKFLVPAVEKGLVNESQVDGRLYNSLKLRFELGLFDPPESQAYHNISLSEVGQQSTRDLNRLMARESMVLMRNPQPGLKHSAARHMIKQKHQHTQSAADARILPFASGKKVAVVGPHFNASQALVGNYLGQACPTYGSFDCITTLLEGVVEANGDGLVQAAQGCDVKSQSMAGFDPALAIAQWGDVVVLAMGIDQSVEGESHDRTSIDLPGVQPQFALKVLDLCKPTALVLIHGGMLAIERLLEHPCADYLAIISAGYPGPEGADAIAAALFGLYSPGGKLSNTWYPSKYISEVSMTSMSFTEFPGRTYKYYQGVPTFTFGYGLSYTSFDMKLCSESELYADTHQSSPLRIKVEVKNTGRSHGDEVIQVFAVAGDLDLPSPPPPMAKKELVAFQRVSLPPNASRNITFSVHIADLGAVLESGKRVVTQGSFVLDITNGVALHELINVHLYGDPKTVWSLPL